MALSLSGYASHRREHGLRGQTHVAVHHAIREGRLTEPAVMKVNGRWQIDPILADAQWAGNTQYQNVSINESAEPEQSGKRKRSALQPQPAGSDDAGLAGVPKIMVSKAVRAAYDAKLAELEYKKQIGARVSIEDVKKEAYSLARRVRESLMNIPDRVSSELSGETDAAVIHMRLCEELESALTELASNG